MQKLHLTSLFLVISLVLAPLVLADDQVTENLKERLKSAVSDVQVNQVEEATNRKGYIGTVTDIIQNTIILEDKEGKKSIKIDDDSTIIRNPGNSKIELTSVQIDDSIIAIGDLIEADELQGKRMIVSANSFSPPTKISGVGTISQLNRYSYSLTSKDSDEELELFFTNKTIYKSPSELLENTDLQEGDEILYTAIKDKDDDWSATIVMQLVPAPTESNWRPPHMWLK